MPPSKFAGIRASTSKDRSTARSPRLRRASFPVSPIALATFLLSLLVPLLLWSLVWGAHGTPWLKPFTTLWIREEQGIGTAKGKERVVTPSTHRGMYGQDAAKVKEEDRSLPGQGWWGGEAGGGGGGYKKAETTSLSVSQTADVIGEVQEVLEPTNDDLEVLGLTNTDSDRGEVTPWGEISWEAANRNSSATTVHGSTSTGTSDGSSSISSTREVLQQKEEDFSIPPFAPNKNETRVAICMTGQARDFDLTGPSILEHLLPAYPNPHLFVGSPLDDNSFKLQMLALAPPGVTIAAVRIFPERWVPSLSYYPELLGDPAAPAGPQGMLRQFEILQRCSSMFLDYEAKVKTWRFNWIVRTRADSYWFQPPPALQVLAPQAHTVPYGSNCLGINDRLDVGRWKTSRIAMSRLALLPLLRKKNSMLKALNPEKVLEEGLKLFSIPVARQHFHFCIISRRVYHHDKMPIASLTTSAPLNGAKCRPCNPRLTGPEADARLKQYSKPASLFPVTTGVDLCDAREAFEKGWEELYDMDAGPEYASQRKKVMAGSFLECVANMGKLQTRTKTWDGPLAMVVCVRRALGRWTKIGRIGESFSTFLNLFKREMGVKKAAGQQQQQPKVLIVRADSDVWDPTGGLFWEAPGFTLPVLLSWEIMLRDKLANAISIMTLHASRPAGPKSPLVFKSDFAPEKGPFTGALALLLLETNDLLALITEWYARGSAPQVCQLMVGFFPTHRSVEEMMTDFGERKADGGHEQVFGLLYGLDFHASHCIQEGATTMERCTFFSSKYCMPYV